LRHVLGLVIDVAFLRKHVIFTLLNLAPLARRHIHDLELSWAVKSRLTRQEKGLNMQRVSYTSTSAQPVSSTRSSPQQEVQVARSIRKGTRFLNEKDVIRSSRDYYHVGGGKIERVSSQLRDVSPPCDYVITSTHKELSSPQRLHLQILKPLHPWQRPNPRYEDPIPPSTPNDDQYRSPVDSSYLSTSMGAKAKPKD
jgi:hypothetical protein